MQEKNGGKNMSSSNNLLLRASIVLGMVAAVVTILYFTPIPDQNFKSCDRPCHELDWPMICRVKLNVEMYQTVNEKCQDCPSNMTYCNNKSCTNSDSPTRGTIIANRQMPGPTIQVCQNDILVVDVTNTIPGHSLSVHWRGQPNYEAPYMDGVAMITQCPINSFTTFQYKFRASSAGTHLYHAHSDTDRSDGLFGALIVRQADKLEPHRKLYDIDDKSHVILISEWSDDMSTTLTPTDDTPKGILINGQGQSKTSSSLAVFNVKPRKRYRFRVAYSGGARGCPIHFSLDNHLIKVIAFDGNPTNPYEASSVVISKGERFDFVLKTNQEPSTYFFKVKSDCKENGLEGKAILNYEGGRKTTNNRQVENKKEINKGRVLDSALCETKLGKVCLSDIKALVKMPEQLRELDVDRKIYLGFNSVKTGSEIIQKGIYRDIPSRIYRINNLTFTYPPSPLLTQPDDVPLNILCNELNVPEKCKEENVCECVHIEHIPLGATTELILFDQGGDEEEHVFHLHGYHFYVVGTNIFDRSVTIEDVRTLDYYNKLFKRNLGSPALKDTIRVPRFGAVAVRFIANNPGFWILRDEQSKGYTRGLDIVFQVGSTSDIPAPPTKFPTCGNFIGPDFFLI